MGAANFVAQAQPTPAPAADPPAPRLRHAIQRMVAHARLYVPSLNDFDVILPEGTYAQLVNEWREEFGTRMGGADFVTLNTANGPMKVYCRGAR